ncbi:hypothetical protein BKA70DRAFT_1417126 [Coprinopsis sp. MPI-PUGE-AT-0042]|nr:hypothetical protein BKA70DRAFT_1417126 [Coprinopsis sp. MPI-PUGE-AT-0042]
MPVSRSSTRKRAAAGDTEAPESSSSTRPAKVQKTAKAKAKGGKKASKSSSSALSAKDFKSKALPIHINITHTPPSIDTTASTSSSPEKAPKDDVVNDLVGGDSAEETKVEAPADDGFIGNLTLLPSSFTTGSYGWKGSKRIVVELQGGEVGEEGREKVQVMLTINATVVGSKQAEKDEEEGDGEEAGEDAEESKD